MTEEVIRQCRGVRVAVNYVALVFPPLSLWAAACSMWFWQHSEPEVFV